MSAEENKALIRRWNEEGFCDYDAYGEYLHENYALYDESKEGWPASIGVEELEKGFREGLAEHPTTVFQIEDIIAEGDRVAARVTWLEEGKPVVNQMQFYRIVDGKIVDAWSCLHQIEE